MNDSQWHNSNSLTSEIEMTKASDAENVNKQTLNEIATIIKTTQSSEAEQANEIMTEELRHAANQPPLKIPMCYSVDQIEVLQTLGNFTFASQYETDEFMQKIVALLKKPDSTKINRLPTPWREKFRCLSLDPNDFIYMEEHLVIPKALRQVSIRSLHYGHPGRDTMLETVSNVWWPRLHREVVNLAKTCPQCQTAGKNIKPLLTQKQFGKLPTVSELNQEIAIDFAGPFKNAFSAKQYLLVSVDHMSGWPEAKFLRKPTTEKVIEFLRKYIARHGIAKSIRADPATIFRSKRFKTFCANRFIKHIECPIDDHRGNAIKMNGYEPTNKSYCKEIIRAYQRFCLHYACTQQEMANLRTKNTLG